MTTDEASIITSEPTAAPNSLTGLPLMYRTSTAPVDEANDAPIRSLGRRLAMVRNRSQLLLDP
jgi:hypothetical protein